MKQKIWKFSIMNGNRDGIVVEIMMPVCTEIIHVAEQNNDICLWGVVGGVGTHEMVKRYFHVIGTGKEFDSEGLKYIGTAQVDGGMYVYHIWERVK